MADRYCDNGPYCLAVYAAVFDDGLPDCFAFRAARDLGPCRVLLSLDHIGKRIGHMGHAPYGD